MVEDEVKRFLKTEMDENARLRRIIVELVSACQYAAGSFAQVPSDKTVPPIVLHDCKDKLDAAWRKAMEALG